MAEIKRTFSGGKMEKDLDERVVPDGQYREALNISVATSEASDVGAAQNILGNIKVTTAIQSRSYSAAGGDGVYAGNNYHVANVVDPQNDMLYRFIHTAAPTYTGNVDANGDDIDGQGIWMDRIVEFDTKSTVDMPWGEKESAIMVDIFKVEASIETYLDRPSSDKSIITVNRNLNQLRWGMRVAIEGDAEDITIELIDYSTGEILLNRKPNLELLPDTPVVFHGDRNLNFGNVEIGTDTNGIRKITGINIIDGMIFWTDNFSEPKKINIERSKDGCDSAKWAALGLSRGIQKIDDFNQHTLLIVKDENPLDMVYDDALNANLITSGDDPNTIPAGGGTWVAGGGPVTPPPGPPPVATGNDDGFAAASNSGAASSASGSTGGGLDNNYGYGG